VLARLATIPCATSVEADHSGRLLRVRVRSDADTERCLDELVRHLAGAGVTIERGDPLARVEAAAATRWYGPDDIAELSREEASRLGDKLARSFALRFALDRGAEGALANLIARHFGDAFVAHRFEPGESAEDRGTGILADAFAAIERDAAGLVATSPPGALRDHLEAEMRARSLGDA